MSSFAGVTPTLQPQSGMSPVSFDPPPVKPVSVAPVPSATKTVASALPLPVGLPARVEQRRPVVRRRRRSVVGDVPVELEARDVRVGARCERDHNERAGDDRRDDAEPEHAAAREATSCRAVRVRCRRRCAFFVSSTLKSARSDASSGPLGPLRFPIPHICDFPLSGRLNVRLPCRRIPPPRHALCDFHRASEGYAL